MRWHLRLLQITQGRFAIMGSLPLEDPASRGKIARWRDQPGMLGLRYTFTDKQEQRQLQEGHLDWLFEEAEKAGVPIAALCTDSLAQFGQIAERHPDLKLPSTILAVVEVPRR